MLNLMAFDCGRRLVLAGKPAVDLENHRLGARFAVWILVERGSLATPLCFVSCLPSLCSPALEARFGGLRRLCTHSCCGFRLPELDLRMYGLLLPGYPLVVIVE